MDKEGKRDNEENTMNAIGGSLPELSKFEKHWAENPNQKSWAFKNMSAGVGHVWHMDDMGLVLQVASDDTMRLLTVIDHEYCFKMISYVKATLDSLDLHLDLNHAIMRPYSKGNDKSKSDDSTSDRGDNAVEVV